MAKFELTLKVGDPAPDFTAPTQTGETVTLSALRGQWVVLYFYPKDNTPGCTVEACGFRDAWETLRSRGVAVLGVSTDSVKSHERFARLFKLPFTLVADPDKTVVKAYGVYAEKSFMGRIGLGTHRVTFLIAPDGRIAEIWPKVKTAGHAAEVLAAIERLNSK
ncbi:MAG: thioredoxin-dependent thiol peroxidase [Verrucomicrobia bacterium]|jgi:peroxiredoxin Q/BCP|nr:thioredoxin-dependent thiol peroxidase [Verrucomicrobiota bacterium]